MTSVVPIDEDRLADPVWSRFPGESNPAWEAFVAYRDAGPSRSLRKVAAHLGKSVSMVDRWSRRHRWQYRVAAYEAHLEEERQRATIAAVRDMAARHAAQARDALSALIVPHQVLIDRLAAAGPDAFDDLDLPDLVDLATRTARVIPHLMTAERLARGEPTDFTVTRGVTVTAGIDLGPADTDALAATVKVLADAGVIDDLLHRDDDTDA